MEKKFHKQQNVQETFSVRQKVFFKKLKSRQNLIPKNSQVLILLSIARYILGVNQQAIEIEMTRPVPTSIIPVENNLVDQEMCFWLGTLYQSKDVSHISNL